MDSHHSVSGQTAETARQGGVSLVEVVVVAVLIVAAASAIAGMTARGQEAQGFVARQTRVTQSAQDLMTRIRGDVRSSTRLFADDTAGRAFLAGLDRSAWQPLSSERLPRIVADATFGKDKLGEEKAGNVLLFAKHLRADVFDLHEGQGSKKLVRTDLYQILCYYLRKMPGADLQNEVEGLDLVRWVSPPLINREQVDEIADPDELRALLLHLFAGTNPKSPAFPFRPAKLLWRIGSPFASAFAVVDGAGDFADVAPGFKLPPDPSVSRGKTLAPLGESIATNVASPVRGVAKFALVTTAGDGFPHGLETQIIGSASARQVLTHLTLVTRNARPLRAWIDLQAVAETRDL